jgi:hypothetical protein
MKTKMIAGGLAALTMLGAGIAVAQPSAPGFPGRNATVSRADVTARVDARFARMDVNRDGKLDAADRAAGLEARFKKLDADGNGSLSFAEFQGAMQHRADRGHGGPGGHRGHHRGGHGFGAGGPAMDTNGDGAVTKAELEAKALAGFDRADADHDGKLTPAERQQARQASRAAPGA